MNLHRTCALCQLVILWLLFCPLQVQAQPSRLSSNEQLAQVPLDLPDDFPSQPNPAPKQQPARAPSVSSSPTPSALPVRNAPGTRPTQVQTLPPIAPAPPASSANSVLIGVLQLDVQQFWQPSLNRALPDTSKLPQLVTDWKKLFNPSAIAGLTEEQLATLLADPQRLLASQRVTEILACQRLLLLHGSSENGYLATQVDLSTLSRDVLQAPRHLNQSESLEFFCERCLSGRGPNQTPVVTNQDSRMFHLPGAIHLSKKSRLTPYYDRALAEREGFQPCPVCFPETNSFVNQSEEDRHLSTAVSKAIEDKYRLSQDPKVNQRLASVSQRLIQANGLRERNYRFIALDSDEPVAFSAPNGPVYITAGLMQALETDDELAGILAHELAHVQLQHTQKHKNRSQLSDMVGTLVRLGSGSYLVGMGARSASQMASKTVNRQQEYEADRQAVITTYAAGYDPQSLTIAITKLEEVAVQLGRSTWGPELLRANPSFQARIKEIEKYAAQLTPLETLLHPLMKTDAALARYLRRQAQQYLRNSAAVVSFVKAYQALRLEQVPQPDQP